MIQGEKRLISIPSSKVEKGRKLNVREKTNFTEFRGPLCAHFLPQCSICSIISTPASFDCVTSLLFYCEEQERIVSI